MLHYSIRENKKPNSVVAFCPFGLDLVYPLEELSYLAFSFSVKIMSATANPEQQKVKSPKPSRRSVTSPKLRPKSSFNNKPLRLRIVLVGDECTGKSCLIKRYCEKRFVAKYLPTIGIDYGATKIFVDKREVGIHIFDTSGCNHFDFNSFAKKKKSKLLYYAKSPKSCKKNEIVSKFSLKLALN